MTDSADSLRSSTSHQWSDQIAEHYACRLAPALADWFDREIWKIAGLHEFHEAVHPTTLLTTAPEPIWPGLMSANLVPLLSNGIGDWLCAAVGADSVMGPIVHWYHGGGDWILWGNDLAEAIVFDALQAHLPGPRRRHAVPAEKRSREAETADPLLSWALSNIAPSVGDTFDSAFDPQHVAETLIDAGVAEVAVRCELIQDALNLSALSSLPSEIKKSLSADADQISQWSLDHDWIPEDARDQIAPYIEPQDWQTAEAHAVAVIEIAPETSWGWDIAGYAAERRGDLETARARYLRAADCPIFSDQSVRLQTHWAVTSSGKFSANRLHYAFPETVEQSDYLKAVTLSDPIDRSDAVSAHWLRLAEQATASSIYLDAHRYLISAGWDLGMRPITAYGNLLERVADAAERSGQSGRARIARIHRCCLKDRYGA